MSDRTIRRADMPGGPTPAGRAISEAGTRRPAAPPSSDDTGLAVEIRGLVERGAVDEARDRFAELVSPASASRPPDRLSVSSRRRRRRRGRPGRLRQGLRAHRIVSRGLAVRGLVHAHSHQRLPRSPQGARAPRALVRSGRRGRTPRKRVRRSAAGRVGSRSAAARARAAGEARRRHRSARRAAADRLHVVPLRRLHAARGQRDDGVERIDGARPPVPRRAQAARAAGRKAVMRSSATSRRGAAVRLLCGGAGRRAARSAVRPSTSPTAPTARRDTASSRASWTVSGPRPTPRPTRCSPPSGCESQQPADPAPDRAPRPRRARDQLPGAAGARSRWRQGVRLRVVAMGGGRRRRGPVRRRRRSACSTTARNHAPQSQCSVVRAAPTAPAAAGHGRTAARRRSLSTTTRFSRSSNARSAARKRRELMPLDALTPHVREIVFDAR